MTAATPREKILLLSLVALTLAHACPVLAQKPGNDPCSGHVNTLQKWNILVGQNIFVQATFRVGAKTRTIYPDYSPYEYGAVIGTATVHFHVLARDSDDHMCDIPQSPVLNLISNASLTVTIHTEVDKPPVAPTVNLTTSTLKTGERLWSGTWTIPAALAGKTLVFVYHGTIDDVPCPSHPQSDDSPVKLTTGGIMTAVRINGDSLADPPPEGNFHFVAPTTIMEKDQKGKKIYCSPPLGESGVEVTERIDKDIFLGSLVEDSFDKPKAITWNGWNSQFNPAFGEKTKWIGPAQNKAYADVVMLLDDDPLYVQDGGPQPVASKRVDTIRLEFIRQDNSVISFSGDDACHMVSKYRTNDNLPDKANFIGPPGANPDPDTFRVQITGLFEGESPTVRLDINSALPYANIFPTIAGKQDDVTKYRTDEHVRLVSNPKDDECLAHQTPSVKLGDIVKATLVLGANDICDLSLPVARPPDEEGPKAIRTADVHFSTLEGVNSTPAMTIVRMTEDWAQAGVRFNLAAAATVKRLSNVLIVVTDTALSDGYLSIDILRPGLPPVHVVSPVKKWNVAQQIANALAAAISAKPGLTATVGNHQDNWLVVVNRGSDVDFANIFSSVPSITTFDELPIDLDDKVSHEEVVVIGINYSDNDDKTVELVAVKNVPIANEFAVTFTKADLIVVPESAVDAPDIGGPFVASHEMGHVFGLDDIFKDQQNLMYKIQSLTDTWFATKRLAETQNAQARTLSGPATTHPILQKK